MVNNYSTYHVDSFAARSRDIDLVLCVAYSVVFRVNPKRCAGISFCTER